MYLRSERLISNAVMKVLFCTDKIAKYQLIGNFTLMWHNIFCNLHVHVQLHVHVHDCNCTCTCTIHVHVHVM